MSHYLKLIIQGKYSCPKPECFLPKYPDKLVARFTVRAWVPEYRQRVAVFRTGAVAESAGTCAG